ncbi:MAG: cytidylate kinase family protein [Butyribacter sp.]|nr:cytidylate kinase family protein [Butyribacter sp.]
MDKTIICVGREYDSGGREIGKKLAEKLHIPCYDKLLLNQEGSCNE